MELFPLKPFVLHFTRKSFSGNHGKFDHQLATRVFSSVLLEVGRNEEMYVMWEKVKMK